MRICIMGAGSLGTILDAYLNKGGLPVDLVDANQEHVDALNTKGARVIGKSEFTVPVHALTPDKMEGIYDLVIYMVKQTFNDIALKQLLPHLGPDSVVLTLQNGMPELAVSEYVGKERTIGGMVGWGATWIGPGVSECTSPETKREFNIGELDGAITLRLLEIQKILSLMCHTEVTSNLMGGRWYKLHTNAALSGMSAVCGCTFGELLQDPRAFRCVQLVGNETIQVAYASGVTLDVVAGFDKNPLAFKDEEGLESTREIYLKRLGNSLLKASMLQDLEKGKRCEVDGIDGVVAKVGRQVGIPTPVTDQVIAIIKGCEDGKYRPSMQNLDLFDPEIFTTPYHFSTAG